MQKYILAHWRGELGLVKSSLLNGVAVYLALLLAGAALGLLAQYVFGDPVAAFFKSPVFIGAVMIVLLIFMLWALVGAFRCGVRNLLDCTNKVTSRIGGAAVMIGVVLVAVFVANDLKHLLGLWSYPMPELLAVMQIIASITLTICSISVAALAASFTYRNHVGWKPRCLLRSDGFGRYNPNPDMRTFLLSFDVWNMRKYPIVIKAITVRPSRMTFNTGIITEEWETTGPHEIARIRNKGLIIAPTSHETINADAVLENPGDLTKVYETVLVTVTYFDPRANKERIVSLSYKHGFYPSKK